MMAHEITHGDPAQRQFIADQIAKAERQSAERRAAREPFEAEESAVRVVRKVNALPPREPLPEFADLRDGGMLGPDRWPSGSWLLPGALLGALIWGVIAALTVFGGN